MKKAYLFFLLLALCVSMISANAQSVKQADHILKGGYGFPNITGSYLNAYKNEPGFKSSSYGPIYAKYEYMLTDDLGLGINLAYAHSEASYDYSAADPTQLYKETFERTSYSMLIRVNKHFGNMDRLDPFVGGGLGFRQGGWKRTYTGPGVNQNDDMPTVIPFGFEFTIGANVFITEKFGMYAEAGLAKSPVQIGVMWRL